MKKKILIIVSVLVICIGFIVYGNITKKDNNNSNIKTNTSDLVEEVDFSNYEKYEVELSDSYVISKEGVYTLTGTIEDGLITVDTKGNVKIILDNVSITNSSGPAILVENANVVYIETKQDSTNYLTDGSSYKDEEVDSTIFSHDNLVLCGSGKLIINSNYNDSIKSKDNLKIISGTYEITSSDDGIVAKDSLIIKNGTFNINTKGDAIKTTNDSDSSLGYIKIEDGEFNIESMLDAIQSVTDITINDGKFNIKTSSGSTSGNIKNNTDESNKGIKAGNNIVINGGNINIDSKDDAIHSNYSIKITNGNIVINSGDDGIHADNDIVIIGGEIDIQKSYEGIEADDITIADGVVSVTSSDDGFNGSGGNDSSSVNGRPGQNGFQEGGNSKITINGGNIYVNSTGDGIDSNGSIYLNGGTVIVNGPTDNGNGALDYNNEFVVTGGILIASGSSGMAQNISSNSSQNGLMINFDQTINSGNIISIKNSDGDEIITYESSKNYQNIVITTPDLKTGETYTVYTNGSTSSSSNNGLYENGNYTGGNKYSDVTINSVTSTIGNASFMQQGGPRNGVDRGNTEPSDMEPNNNQRMKR